MPDSTPDITFSRSGRALFSFEQLIALVGDSFNEETHGSVDHTIASNLEAALKAHGNGNTDAAKEALWAVYQVKVDPRRYEWRKLVAAAYDPATEPADRLDTVIRLIAGSALVITPARLQQP